MDEVGPVSFASYYVAHRRWLVSLVARAVPNPLDVEDLCADVFTAALEKRAYVGDYAVGQQRKWLYEAASKEMMKRSRKWARHQQALERAFHESPDEGGNPLVLVLEREAALEQSEWDACVREVLESLRTEHRHVLELRAAGLKGPAIAERLGVSHQLARTWLMLARKEFARLWRLHDGPGPVREHSQ